MINFLEVINEIIYDIEKNNSKLTYRKYETFFSKLGMLRRRNFNDIQRLDQEFKNRNITFWLAQEPIKSLADFEKGTSITFRQSNYQNNMDRKEGGKVSYASTVTISKSVSRIKPHLHQTEAFEKLQEKIIKSNKNPFAGLLVLPTGGGKTLTAALWLAKNILDKKKKVLWIAHRHELLEQAKSAFVEKLAYKDIFKNIDSFNYRIISGIHDRTINILKSDDLIISSKDSLNAGFNHLNKIWFEDGVDEVFLVIDEAHHATARTYRNLIEKIKGNVSNFALLGLTATPTRTAENEQGLLQKIFPDDIVYKIDLKRLIGLGILAEPIFEDVATGQNFIKELSDSDIAKINTFDINSIGDKIAKSISENSERNYLIVDRYVKNKDKYKQTLVFALNQDNAIALNALFKAKQVKSDFVISSVKDAVTGNTSNFTKENREKIERFRNGELEVLINVNILTEGTDMPNIQSVFLARPTISTILMTQMIGRGLRGLNAGGTKDAYIVSFIDDWQDKIAWVNPEKLMIEEGIDFDDSKDIETKKQLLRLVAISKIEEFAILSDESLDATVRKALENLDFIQRIPKGIFQFRFLEPTAKKEIEKVCEILVDDNLELEPTVEEEIERVCEILVYDNLENAYKMVVETLPAFFEDNKLTERESLTANELNNYAQQLEDKFFSAVDKYPAYRIQDIKNILQYYAVQYELPQYMPLKDRELYDIDKVAQEICDKDLGPKSEKEFLDTIWAGNEIAWQTFFNYDKLNLIREVDLAKRKINHPTLFGNIKIKPIEEFEAREYERMTMAEIRERNPKYEQELRDLVFEKFSDENGFYYSAINPNFKSKNRLAFQVDHIRPMHDGGLTVLDNLQLLTRSENAEKGIKSPNYRGGWKK